MLLKKISLLNVMEIWAMKRDSAFFPWKIQNWNKSLKFLLERYMSRKAHVSLGGDEI